MRTSRRGRRRGARVGAAAGGEESIQGFSGSPGVVGWFTLGEPVYGRWRQMPAIRPADLFDDWGEGQQRDLYVYITFTKGDLDPTGISVGVFVDDVFLGRHGLETLGSYTYDVNACAIGQNPPAACQTGSESNRYLGSLTHLKSYHDNRLVSHTTSVYKDLNGRLSGETRRIDWAGVGDLDKWTVEYGHDLKGLVTSRSGAYRATNDSKRTYEHWLDRGTPTAIWVEQQDLTAWLLYNTAYTAAGTPQQLQFANETVTTITFDERYRPKSFQIEGPDLGGGGGLVNLWNSGVYVYDGAGNITNIGNQGFAYDLHGRLKSAYVEAQAQGLAGLYTVDYGYDDYGNMFYRLWDNHGELGTEPDDFAFDLRNYTNNRVTDPGFDYDLNGNMTRMPSTVGEEAALWDDQNRMTAFSRSDEIREMYLYDADGYRLVRYDLAKNRPTISIRDAAGQLISDYVQDPGALTPSLVKDYVYSRDRLLVERQAATYEASSVETAGTFYIDGKYQFQVRGGTPGEVYRAHIQTLSGYSVLLTGITLDANSGFEIDESYFALGETNYIRVQLENEDDALYSAAATLTIDPNVSGSSANQIVAVGVHRTGTDIVLRWRLLNQNGSDTTLYFDHGGEGPVEQVLNLAPIPPGTTTYTIAEQSLANQSGVFLATQNDGSGESGYNEGVNLPKVYVEFMQCISCSGDDDDDDELPDPTYYVFYDSYHHRDHLGNLRVVTGSVGELIVARDYYPFGVEMTDGLPPAGGSDMRFAGHERQQNSELDYMLARYYEHSAVRFLSTDPAAESVAAESPQSWNRFAYVLNNPIRLTDPSGKVATIEVDEDNLTIMVTANIDIFGPGGSSQLAAQIEADIETAWNGQTYTDATTGTTYSVAVDVNVNYVGRTSLNATAENQIKVVRGVRSESSVAGFGTWDTGHLVATHDSNVRAHEFGHLAGLRDDYYESPVSGNWRPHPRHDGHMMAGSTSGGSWKVDRHEIADMVSPAMTRHNERWFPGLNRRTSMTVREYRP